jgi:S-adenosylhomocysteine hydrolase
VRQTEGAGLTVIRVSSRALGPRVHVRVCVYDDVHAMRAAADGFNGTTHVDALGVTQATVDRSGRAVAVIVRLAVGHLGTQVVSHEMHHAATALYGAHVGDRPSRAAHLNHFNEPFAHLYSDLLARLVGRLYALGFYA